MPTPVETRSCWRSAERTTLALAAAFAATMPAPGASAAGDPLADAQARITAAQEAADRAAAAFDVGQARYYALERDADITRKTVAQLRADQQHLAALVSQ